LCDRIRAAGPRVEYHTAGDVDALDLGVQLTAYRIVQEALTNALKHAGPQTRIQLTLRADRNQLRILVRDSGSPPGAPRQPRAEEGHGLVGMRERAALYDGNVAVGPGPAGGWTVEATLDLTPLPDFGGADQRGNGGGADQRGNRGGADQRGNVGGADQRGNGEEGRS
jgi:signal transduction histidine kinase